MHLIEHIAPKGVIAVVNAGNINYIVGAKGGNLALYRLNIIQFEFFLRRNPLV